MLHNLRTWDARTAHGPDLMLANSNYVRARIRRIYGRHAEVVFPPVETDKMVYSEDKDDYYVTASFLAPYKRTDLVIEAFNEMPNKQLLVVGDGQQSKSLRDLIRGDNIRFTGFLPRGDYLNTIAQARALVFGGCEDFGIALAEAQAAGTPLIAFGRGGAVDIARTERQSQHPTGILFKTQTIDAVKDAIEHFETDPERYAPAACRDNADRFAMPRFTREIEAAFDAAIEINRNH
jgi:glycosyltransferase involved in cell wall biosynthesis